MRNKRAAIAAAPLSLALLLAACGSDDDSADPTDTTTTTTEATTSSSSELGTPPPSTDPAAPPSSSATTAPPAQAGDPLPTDTPEWAAELVRAWGAGDRDRAAELATPEAVDQLFAHADPGGGDWRAVRCEGAAGTIYCTFHSAARAETLVTRQSNMPDEATGALAPVTEVQVGPDGVDEETLGAQSDPMVRAWGAGDRAEATAFAHPDVVAVLFDTYDPGGPDWDRRDCLDAGDDPICIYYDPNRDQRLIVHFDPSELPAAAVIADVEFRDGASG